MSNNQSETIHNIIANYQSANYQKINVYGIVTFIGSKNNKCTNLTLVDETCTETEKLKCLVFERSMPIYANCELGDVVRLNRIKVQSFNDQPQGVCNELFGSWVRFKRNNPHSYSGQSNNVDQDDLNRVNDLFNWLNTNPKNQSLYEAQLSVPIELSTESICQSDLDIAAKAMNMQNLDQINQESNKIKLTNFSILQRDTYVNIVCQICALCENKGVKFVLVWDGSRSDFSIHQESEFKIEQSKNKVLFSKKIVEQMIPIYIFDEFVQQLDNLKPGDFVLFKNARVCPAPNNSDADLLIKMPGVQNSNQTKYGRSITKLASFDNTTMFTGHGADIDKIIENLSQKCKEYELTFISDEQFLSEIRTDLFNDTFSDLIEKKTKLTKVRKQTILSQVNELMNEDTQMYISEEEADLVERPGADQNENLLDLEPMAQDQLIVNKKIDPLAISQDIYMLNKLVNLTYICPFMSSSVLDISDQMYQKQYPFYTNIKNLIDDSMTKPYIKCKVIAKLYNYSASSSPHISMVFLKCKKCNYLNFTPIHLACAYQSAHLNNLLNIPEVKSQISRTMDQNGSLNPFEAKENMESDKKKALNFSLDWLETAMPSNFDSILFSQQESDTVINYAYMCPRCAQEKEDSQEKQFLDYIYRLWFVLRDADAKLDPCLIEEDVALKFLDGIEPIKFYTNQLKGHQVYKIIHKNFNKKFLFTLELFNLKLIRNEQDKDGAGIQPARRLDCVYKIVNLEELNSK